MREDIQKEPSGGNAQTAADALMLQNGHSKANGVCIPFSKPKSSVGKLMNVTPASNGHLEAMRFFYSKAQLTLLLLG